MRWSDRELGIEQPDALPGLARLNNLVRSVTTPEFKGVTFHEILAKSALNKVPGGSKALPFGWTINPYRGCSHACAYCLSPETHILKGDGRQVRLGSIRLGDEVYGTERRGAYRRFVRTTVTDVWSTTKRAFRVTLADGTTIIASGDHRFLSERGWKFVTGTTSGSRRRPHLTASNRLLGFGMGGRCLTHDTSSAEYRRGYLTGMIRGDGMLFHKRYPPRAGGGSAVWSFRLALADAEALERAQAFLRDVGVETTWRPYGTKSPGRREMAAIHSARRRDFERIREVIEWPAASDGGIDWQRGFLAGMFDAEGSCSRGVLRISNKDRGLVKRVRGSLDQLGIAHVDEKARDNGVIAVRVTGGLPARERMFHAVGPAISRKMSLDGVAVKSFADLRVVRVEDLGIEIDMLDITTGTGDFIANGVVSHNCFARPTHRYLDLNMGTDFDSQVVVKVNVADVLRRELSRPGWERHPVALGTNTDPYQRAEGRYRLMPGIIGALADSGTPFSILTKGSLLRRDLDLLAGAAERVPVDVAMSIAIYDDELQRSIEPGTPTTAARLATVTAVRERGLGCQVFLMPILPYLTDSREHLDEALRRARDAGATSVLYTALHLRSGVKEWFTFWLEREHPELLEPYRRLYGGGAYAPKEYRKWLAARIRPLIRRYGLEQGREDPATGGVRSSALAMQRGPDGERLLPADSGERLLPADSGERPEPGGSGLRYPTPPTRGSGVRRPTGSSSASGVASPPTLF